MSANALNSPRRQWFSSSVRLHYISTSSASFTTGTESSNPSLSATESARSDVLRAQFRYSSSTLSVRRGFRWSIKNSLEAEFVCHGSARRQVRSARKATRNSAPSGRSVVGQSVRRRGSALRTVRSAAPARGIGVRRNGRTDMKRAPSRTDQRMMRFRPRKPNCLCARARWNVSSRRLNLRDCGERYR